MKRRLVFLGAVLFCSAILFSLPSQAAACSVCVTEGEPDGCTHSLFFNCTQKFTGCQSSTGCSCCLRDPNQVPKKRVVKVACSKSSISVKQVVTEKAISPTTPAIEIAHAGG